MNIPNTLAWVRIGSAPLLFLLLVNRSLFDYLHESWIDYFAALIFVIAAFTDYFDGMIARLWNQTTVLGAILDPLADKLLTLSAFLGLMVIGRANAWAVFVILGREFFITGLRVMAASEGKNVAAGNLGKYKTGMQIAAVIALILGWFSPLGEVLLWLAVALTLWSGYAYVRTYSNN